MGDVVRKCDQYVTRAIEDLLGSSLSPTHCDQEALPLSVGGCGLRLPTRVRPAARIAALARFYSGGATALGLPEVAREPRPDLLSPVVTELHSLLGVNFDPVAAWMVDVRRVASPSADHLQQKWWSAALGRASAQALLDKVGPRDQARLLEQSNSVGSAFMSATPSAVAQTVLPSDHYQLGL